MRLDSKENGWFDFYLFRIYWVHGNRWRRRVYYCLSTHWLNMYWFRLSWKSFNRIVSCRWLYRLDILKSEHTLTILKMGWKQSIYWRREIYIQWITGEKKGYRFVFYVPIKSYGHFKQYNFSVASREHWWLFASDTIFVNSIELNRYKSDKDMARGWIEKEIILLPICHNHCCGRYNVHECSESSNISLFISIVNSFHCKHSIEISFYEPFYACVQCLRNVCVFCS